MPDSDLTVAVAVHPGLFKNLFSQRCQDRLAALGVLRFQEQETRLTEEELIELIQDCEVVITGWGTPPFSQTVMDSSPDLRVIAHSAGSIKRLLPQPVWNRNILVIHAAAAIAPAVAEMTLLLILMCRRDVHRISQRMKKGEQWPQTENLGYELSGSRVGIIGAGHTGRNVIRVLQALDTELWVYDPYLSLERAQELGVRQASLEEIMSQCPIITVQAPPTEETYHMIDKELLDKIPDGALFVNTARSHVVDADSLYESLMENRYLAALDVFDTEPLPVDSRLRKLANVTLTPHIAGKSENARKRQGVLIVEELEKYARGEQVTQRVTQDMLATMA